ncbi:hypothetical protein BC834DRAFT_925561 [Gloeopeniophorella convolvens]|nr:hypothetical protein BC834DRAFT_925561 [Gloeopeniophorella convolvens]
MSPLSSVGKKVLFGYGVIIFLNILVLALSNKVNNFQDYFYMADIFPLVLSSVTLFISVLMLALDLGLSNSPTARPPFEIGLVFVLSILWLAFNAFSTSRWRHIPLNCSSIPADFSDVRSWCKDLQALKAFVWVNWVVLFLVGIVTLRWSVTQHQSGQKHVWRTPLSRFARREGHKRSTTVASGMTQIDDFLRFSR